MQRFKVLAGMVLVVTAGALGGCASGSRTAGSTGAPVVDSAAVRLAGAYIGTLPCADCEGIETALLLRADASFQLATRRLATPADSTTSGRGPLEVQHGRFQWNRSRGELSLDSVVLVVNRYLVGESQLTPLDSLTSTPLAERHVLKKSGSGTPP